MAHLSDRHEDAKRRRDELLRERAAALATRTGYPFDHQAARRRPATVNKEPPPSELYEPPRKWTKEEIAEASRMCELRVHSAREQEARKRREELEKELERRRRSEEAGAAAPDQAARRLKERRVRERQQQEADLELLIAQQSSSIRAMNIARMLSPRFEERVTFAPQVPRRSREDERVTQLLEGGGTIGNFYK